MRSVLIYGSEIYRVMTEKKNALRIFERKAVRKHMD
jgi:hypothetical protein